MDVKASLFVSLLQLSPKKTWEGFIGGFFSTVVFGFIVSTLRRFPPNVTWREVGLIQTLEAAFLRRCEWTETLLNSGFTHVSLRNSDQTQTKLRPNCFFSVVVFQLSYLLSQFQYCVCPVGFNSETNGFTVECEPSDIFVMQEYTLPAVVQNTLRWVRPPSSVFTGKIRKITQICRTRLMRSKITITFPSIVALWPEITFK